jgi:Uma2 family endonuclease
MATLITDPIWEEELRLKREESGADRYDEVWEGLYVMTPIPNDEHQQIVARLTAILQETVGWCGLGEVRPGINLSDRREDWTSNYRAPDVAVSLRGGKAENYGTHWRGAADLLVEITSPGDRSREKIPFYSLLGVRELWVVDRSTWTLELYRWHDGELRPDGQSSLESPNLLHSDVVPLKLRLVPGSTRPNIEVTHPESGRSWLV